MIVIRTSRPDLCLSECGNTQDLDRVWVLQLLSHLFTLFLFFSRFRLSLTKVHSRSLLESSLSILSTYTNMFFFFPFFFSAKWSHLIQHRMALEIWIVRIIFQIKILNKCQYFSIFRNWELNTITTEYQNLLNVA